MDPRDFFVEFAFLVFHALSMAFNVFGVAIPDMAGLLHSGQSYKSRGVYLCPSQLHYLLFEWRRSIILILSWFHLFEVCSRQMLTWNIIEEVYLQKHIVFAYLFLVGMFVRLFILDDVEIT